MTTSIEELATTELLRGVPEATLRLILDESHVLTLAAGECLLSPEIENHHICLLLSGSLSVHFMAPDSSPIRIVQAGWSVGELSVIDRSAPTAYVLARETCRVFRIHRNLIDRLIGDTCPLANNLLSVLARWIKTNTTRMVENQYQIDTLTNHANVDGLTGLYNRRWLDGVVGDLLELGQPLSVLVLDVDHFKRFNDSYGHLAGDRALTALSQVLKTTVRPSDCLVRFGGEEFLVLLPKTELSVGIAIAERIRRSVQQRHIFTSDGDPLPGITVSIGLAVSAPGVAFSALLAAADTQLYRAKDGGRNRVSH